MKLRSLLIAVLLSLLCAPVVAQAGAEPQRSELKFVVYLSRHGVRSPTGKPEQYNPYSKAPWPEWSVAPGLLTSHGYRLMEFFGAYDRQFLAGEGLLSAIGCTDAPHVRFIADSDQRTRETGHALAAGMFPGCPPSVAALPEGTTDPLFHSLAGGVGKADPELAAAAIAGRIGGDPLRLTESYRPQLAELDHILSSCGASDSGGSKRVSLFDIPSSLSAGKGDHGAELKGPLMTAGTLTENLLLEYSEGLPVAQVGWGCVDGARLRELIELHTASSNFTRRTKAVARMQVSNLLDHIRRALQQAATGKPVAGAPSSPADLALFLVGHDTNIANVSGLLDLTWTLDGRRDDTPPGGALVFELWRSPSGELSVRTFYTAQTLEQMRNTTVLTPLHPPGRVPVALPGCNRADLSCPWEAFDRVLREAEDLRYVAADHE
ncbi:MAG: histidine-type phosphatase [Acidobacteriota bacterium]|nr:histidine-type phosphatase [Acidobacteriota bacterium]